MRGDLSADGFALTRFDARNRGSSIADTPADTRHTVAWITETGEGARTSQVGTGDTDTERLPDRNRRLECLMARGRTTRWRNWADGHPAFPSAASLNHRRENTV